MYQRWVQAGLRGLVRAASGLPADVIGRLVGPTPVNDRGAELDYQAHILLRLMDSTYRPALDELGAERARRAYSMACEVLGHVEDHPGSVVTRHIPGPKGSIPARIYRSRERVAGREGAGIVFYHGGGFVVGGLRDYDAVCRYLARLTGCTLISVGYRLAPEHPFPAAVEDGVAAFEWVAGRAEGLGLDEARLAVAGDSAGGNLAAVVAQQAMLREGPSPCRQWLIYPTTDARPGHRSMALFAQGYHLDASVVRWFSKSYLQDYRDLADARVSPVTFDGLELVAPAYVVTAGFDPLRDKGEAYVEALREAGVEVVHREFEGLVHGFLTMSGVLDAAGVAIEEMAAAFGAMMDE